jgi:phenylpyruvate tautomerase PptA (4-oxalocrotonate tautomerase family)
LVTAVTDALAGLGVPPAEIDVVIREQPRGHWARGGVLASERELDFKVDI